MSNKEVKITIEAIDKFSKIFDQLDDDIANVSKSASKLGDAFSDFAEASGSSKLQSAAKSIAEIGVALGTVQGRAGLAVKAISEVVQGYIKLYDASKKNFASNIQTLGNVFSTIGSAVAGATTQVASFITEVTGIDLTLTGLGRSAVTFGEELTRAFITAGGGSDELKDKMKGAAQEVSMQYGRSINEVAQGMQEIASAGMDAEQVIELLGATTAVSMAGNLDMARSAEVLTNTMRAFKEEAFDSETAMRYANVLAAVSDRSATDINQIGEALKNSANMAGQMGYSVEDVGTVIGLMGNQFVKSGRAGTALNNVMTRLASQNSNCMKTIQEYNLEGYKQKMLSGDLVGAMMELQNATKDLTNDEKALVAAGLAGQYGMQGLLAVMGQTAEETQKFQNEIKGSEQAMILQAEMAATTSGKMSQLASTIGVVGEAIYSKFEPHLRTALDSATQFARGLVEIGDQGYYVVKSLDQLAVDSVEWGKNINQGIQDAIDGIKNFVDGGSLADLLTIGTNIIKGICDGISKKAEDGTLKDTFSKIIKDICKFIEDNEESIGKAGKDILTALADAIKENEDIIKGALDDLMGIITEWAEGSSELKSAAGLFADTFINGLVDQSIEKAQGRGGEIWNAMFSGITLEDGANIKNGQGSGGLGGFLTENTMQGRGFKAFDDFVGSMSQRAGQKLKEGAQWVWDGVSSWFGGESYAAEIANQGGQQLGTSTGEGVQTGLDAQGMPIVDSATKTGTDAAAGIQTALQSMDLQYLQSLGTEMANVGTLTATMAQSMTTSFTSIADSARTQFTNLANIARNQMTNVSNSIRTEMTNCTNIVNNQATNMANAVRTQFVNMGNIAKNQFSNIANSIRTEMVNCANIINNQCSNMAQQFTSQFTNMANTVRTQFVNISNIINNQCTNMANTARTQFTNITNIVKNQMQNCQNAVQSGATAMTSALTSGMSGMESAAKSAMDKVVAAVRNGMSQAKAIASQPITINITSNISRKVTTTHVSKSASQTMRAIAGSSITVLRPNVMATTGGGASINKIPAQEKGYTFTIPVIVDGREVARATAKYSQSELDRLSKRNSRKRGE